MKPMIETFWNPGEPNGGIEHCAFIDVAKGPAPLTSLSDVNCDASYNYICEV
jgi:hypothetical protein